jgi:oxygen-independent coproporphyrinogen III oxidase
MAGIYIHIPFCERKCIYCDFYSIPDPKYFEPFQRAVEKEIVLISEKTEFPEISTIYFGGGTPSFFPPSGITSILEKIYVQFGITKNPEITIEANPNSINKESLKHYLSSGINRISIGVQSFHSDELKFLQRLHSNSEAVNSYYLSRECGFENISLDLIYSIPGSNLEKWKFNLDKILELNPEHVSAYSLIYEEDTGLFFRMQQNEYTAISEETEAEMYLFTMKYLQSGGYNHYEVSNYSQPGRESLHNSAYWNHDPYIGFGPSAHSFYNNYRYWNYRNIEKYIDCLKNDELPVESGEEIDKAILFREKIFLGLRSKGINLKEISCFSDSDFLKLKEKEISRLIERKYIKMENGIISLTDEGFLVCDEICKMLM